MKKLSLLFALLGVVALVSGASAADINSVGVGQGVIVPGPDENPCPGSSLFCNHDGSFENGFAWQYGGIVPPYYGAFAEYYSGAGTVCGVQLHLTTLSGYFVGQNMDVYTWDGAGIPGNVLGVTTGIVPSPPAIWPNISTHDIDVTDVAVPADWWVGYWGNWPGALTAWFIAADSDGFGGFPYTNIAPGIGYPTGWNNVSVVWGPYQSIGICGYWTTEIPNPTQNTSWGAIKALYN